jgi:fructokinase
MYLICGEALYDVYVEPVPADGNRQVTLYAKAGGSPHNVAIGLARLGAPVALATEMATDTLGTRLEQRLRSEGVDCQFVRRTAKSTPLAMVDIDPNGVARYAFHGLDGLLYHPDLAAVKKKWGVIHGVHVGSIPIVSSQSAPQLQELVAAAPERVLVSFDPNVRLSLEPDVMHWRKAVDTFRRYAHLIKVAQDDLTQLYGEQVDVDAVAQSWLEYRCSLVMVTRSERGATLYSRTHGAIKIAPVHVVVADTVGAGDSFQAAALAWLAEGRRDSSQGLARLTVAELETLGRFAARAAAITCRYRGPEFPYRKALDER